MNLISWLISALWQSWAYFWSGRTFAIVLGIGFAVLALTLLVLSRTRWGQAKPLTKCVVLSLLAHVWLIMYAVGNRMVLPQGNPHGRDDAVYVAIDQSFADFSEEQTSNSDQPHESWQPWEAPVPANQLPAPDLLPVALEEESLSHDGATTIRPDLDLNDPLRKNDSQDRIATPPLLDIQNIAKPNEDPIASRPDTGKLPDSQQTTVAQQAEPGSTNDPNKQPVAQPHAVLPPVLPLTASDNPPLANSVIPDVSSEQFAGLPSNGFTESNRKASSGPVGSSQPSMAVVSSSRPSSVNPQIPTEYQLRQAPNRLQLALPFGADADSEAAVEQALAFLAKSQSPDGSWNAKKFGAGTETRALGENRYGTGERADTGVSGLALLAFLAAGHTHRDGQHQLVVRHGLEFLLRAQSPSGDLSGPKQIGHDPSVTNAKMYCHGIATLAMAEAYAMTHDPALQQPLAIASRFTLGAQDKRSGGWRYRPGDPGDLSQFGWQAMALRSAELSGVSMQGDIPLADARLRMRMFIDSCSAGKHGGLARYRPGDGIATSTMTAEGLACRYLMNWPLALPAQREAESMLISNLPGVGQDNVYYWYYATLALFQLQNDSWRQWNQALKTHLLRTQVPAYQAHAGSWTPDALWGGYGGRIYSTAMSCLCLEVYYRYLPMYQRSNLAQTPASTTSR